MEFLLQVHKPVRGSTTVYTGHDFAAAVDAHQNAVFIVDEADVFIENYFAVF